MFYLMTHSIRFVYVTWYRTTQRVREETRCRHNMDYSFRLAARVLLYASSHRQDNTYHGLCYTSRGALAGTRNSTMSRASTTELHLAPPILWKIRHSLKKTKKKEGKEGNVLFNDALNTFYLRLYGVLKKKVKIFFSFFKHKLHRPAAPTAVPAIPLDIPPIPLDIPPIDDPPLPDNPSMLRSPPAPDCFWLP